MEHLFFKFNNLNSYLFGSSSLSMKEFLFYYEKKVFFSTNENGRVYSPPSVPLEIDCLLSSLLVVRNNKKNVFICLLHSSLLKV